MKLMLIGAVVVTGTLAASQTIAADGKEIYTKACQLCHQSGLAKALKLDDKAAWEPLIKRGPDALTASVIKGKGAMPPRAGNAALSDLDIKAAVEYMISQAK